jgi:hypothetical protein
VLRIIAVTFFLLAAYVLCGSVIDLATRAQPERSLPGIVLTAGSLLIMPLLGWRKRRAGEALRNPLLLADASETILCATLAATTLLGLVLFRGVRLVVGRPGRRPRRRLVRGTRRPRGLGRRSRLRRLQRRTAHLAPGLRPLMLAAYPAGMTGGGGTPPAGCGAGPEARAMTALTAPVPARIRNRAG